MYDTLFSELADYEPKTIFDKTGCQRPCSYRRYEFLGQPQLASFETKDFLTALFSYSNYNRVETKELIYPLSSLVAEFGGILGLFIGFSFMTLWDRLMYVNMLRQSFMKAAM